MKVSLGILHKLLGSPHPYLLKVLFEPLAKNGLECYFALYCQGAIIDPVSSFGELRIWACVSSTREAIPTAPEATATVIED